MGKVTDTLIWGKILMRDLYEEINFFDLCDRHHIYKLQLHIEYVCSR